MGIRDEEERFRSGTRTKAFRGRNEGGRREGDRMEEDAGRRNIRGLQRVR